MSSNIKSLVQMLLVAVLGSTIGVLCVIGAKHVLASKASEVVPQQGDFSTIVASVKNGNETPILITKTGCPACKKAKEWLAKNEINVFLVISDKQVDVASKLMEQTDTSAVPALITKNKIIVGFDEKVWESAKLK